MGFRCAPVSGNAFEVKCSWGEIINNSDPDDDNEGYLAGFEFGHRKIKALGDWQFKYNCRRLERDAWPDIFPDSDFFGGATGAKGHEGVFKLGLGKHVSMDVDYYSTEEIDGDTEQDLLQVDLNLKY